MDCSCWHSLITSCIDILSHKTKSCSSVSPYMLYYCMSIAIVKCCRPQFPTLHTDVFPTDLNAVVPLLTVPIETLVSWAVFVTEAPAIRCRTMNPSFKVTSIFFSCYLDTNSKSTGPAQHFYTRYNDLLDVKCLLVPCSAPVWKHLHS